MLRSTSTTTLVTTTAISSGTVRTSPIRQRISTSRLRETVMSLSSALPSGMRRATVRLATSTWANASSTTMATSITSRHLPAMSLVQVPRASIRSYDGCQSYDMSFRYLRILAK
ncbi:cyanovirin-N family protein [Alternaria sp. MG1]|nr:cyanovirin-N family protein [Alternaria sp. MG1]